MSIFLSSFFVSMLCSLCRQLLLLSDLFDPKYLPEHVYPLALLLSADKVAEVRTSASFLVCVCVYVCVCMCVYECVCACMRTTAGL